MIFLICYDIVNDKLRTRIAKLCENYAFERIQYSVFVGDTSRNMAETFALEARELIKKRLAKISIVPICQNCYEKVITIGSKPELKRKQMTLNRKQQEKVIVL